MAYRLNKTNGDLLVELADGVVDTTSSDIALIGRNYKSWGEVFNENFIKLVENFANSLQPDNPITGQLWYDTNEQRLKIYNGTIFIPAGAPLVTANRPELTVGNLWIDNENRQLYFYDGNQEGEYTLVGPDYTFFQGQSGWETRSAIDTTERSQTLLLLYIGGDLFAAFTNSTFRLAGAQKIAGYPDDPNDTVFPRRQLFTKGFNLVDKDINFAGVADSALSLTDAQGNQRLASDFLSSTGNAQLDGNITINNSFGLLLGNGSSLYSQLRLDSNNVTVLRTVQDNADIAVQTNVGSSYRNAIYVKGSNNNVGIQKSNPQSALDVEGDLSVSQDVTVDGNLTVNGNATYINVNNLRVEDKNIELGLLGDSTIGSDSDIDGAGLIVQSLQGSKDILYDNATKTWSSNQDFNLIDNHRYKIDNTVVLSKTELGDSITKAAGLTEIGVLDFLDVDNLNFNSNTISTQTTGLVLDPFGDISVSNSTINDLGNPSSEKDATNKQYVDETVRSQPVALALDTTGLAAPTAENPYEDVKDILQSISPASEKQEGTTARIHCVSYENTTITGIDVASAMDKDFVSVTKLTNPVDLEDNLQSESVVKDINFTSVNTSYNATPSRQTMIFRISSGNWSWVSTN
jgi:hypothetical protein